KDPRAVDAEHGQAEAARKAVVDREKALASEAKKSRAAIEEEKERVAKLEAEIGDLKKRAAKAEELRERESELNAKSKSIGTRANELASRETARRGIEAQVRAREDEAGKVAGTAAQGGDEVERDLGHVEEAYLPLDKAGKELQATQ